MTQNITLLSDLATDIKVEHAAVSTAFKSGLSHAIRAGQLLLEAKKHHQHGSWGDWVDANLQFSQRTAQGYMQVAKNADKLDDQMRNGAADFSLRQVMKQIGDKNRTTAKPTPSSADVAHQVEELKNSWNRAVPATRQAFRDSISEPTPATREEPVAPAVATTADILDRMFGPLSGAEWSEMADECSYRTGRGKNRKRVISERFLKLVAFHGVPLAEVEAAE